MDIRKFGVMIAVAILTAILIYSLGDAIAPQVDYNTCHGAKMGPDPVRAQQTQCTNALIDDAARKTCIDGGYAYEEVYDGKGCISSYACNTCYKEQEALQERHNMMVFYAAIILGLVAIVIGFLLPLGSIHEWVGLGFIVGGVIGLFIGTVQYWNDLARIVRPIVIFIELLVVLFIVYRRLAGRDTPDSAAPAQAVRKLRTTAPRASKTKR